MVAPSLHQLELFTKEFFTKLGATVEPTNNGLYITNTPQAFQKFYGKHEPYTIVFDKAHEIEGTELMVKGSYLLKAMTAYLDSRGQTTLVKLTFEDDPQTTLQNNVSFAEGTRLTHVAPKRTTHQLVRFTFQTTFKYLNEKEIVSTEVYVQDGQVIDFDPSKYDHEEGRKRDIQVEGVKEGYAQAKDVVKEKLQPKIAEISGELTTRLKKEMARVRSHYDQQIHEIDRKLAKDLAQLKELENTTKDIPNKEQKMQRLREQIRGYQKDNARETLSKEADFFANAETKKHGLALDTKLLNTTIFYYPVFEYGTFLKRGSTERLVSFVFNPVKGELSTLRCDACKNELQSIALDSGGHVICPDCQVPCEECQQPSCNACLKHTCATTHKTICNACAGRCQKCAKTRCKKYLHEHPVTKIKRCHACWTTCPECHSLNDESEMRGNVCQGCARKRVGVDVRKAVFNRDDW